MTLFIKNKGGCDERDGACVFYAAASRAMYVVLPRMVVLLMACAAVNAFGTQAKPTDSNGAPFHVRIPSKLAAALRRGNKTVIRRLIRDGKLKTPLSTLAVARVRYDIPKLLTTAKACERKLASSTSRRMLAHAFYCNGVARMSALGLGAAQSFLQEAQFGHEVLLSRLSKAYGRTLVFGNGLDRVDLLARASATPALVESWASGKKVIALRAVDDAGDGWQGLQTEVVIDGRRSPAHLGISSTFPSPLTIVTRYKGLPAVYRQFGLVKVVDPLGPVSLAGSAKPSLVSVALAPRVSFGPLTVHNLAVMLVQSDSLTPGVYLGMSALRWFGGVLIGDHQMALSRTALSICHATIPMNFASDADGDGQLVFPVRVNGTRLEAIWNPDLRSLIAMKSGAIEGSMGKVNGFSSDKRALPRPITIRVGTVVVHPRSVMTPAHWGNAPFQVAIGAGILHQHQIYLQFRGKTPLISICPIVVGR